MTRMRQDEAGRRLDRSAGMPTADPGEPGLQVLADPAAVADEAARRIAAALATAVEARGVAHWVTTGGSAPPGIYRVLIGLGLRDTVPWARVHLWWGDDRFVRRTDPLSNVRPVDELLLAAGGVPIPTGSIHPIPADEALGRGSDNAWAAERYAQTVADLAPRGRDGWPGFDVALIGVGPDGHLLSVFPGSTAWDSPAVALPIPAPTHVEPHVERVTLNPAFLDGVGELLVVITGETKAPVVAEILGPIRDERRWPAQRARRAGATWLLDAAAAGRIGVTR